MPELAEGTIRNHVNVHSSEQGTRHEPSIKQLVGTKILNEPFSSSPVQHIKSGFMKTFLPLYQSMRESILFKDARNFQILFLSSFLMYGTWSLGWDIELDRYSIILSVCMLTQLSGVLILKLPLHSMKSGMITALGLCLLFKADSATTIAAGAFLAIAAKFIIRFNGKHLFNPANFGIIISILLFGDAWISPGQWGSSALLLFFVGSAGIMVIFKVGRIDTSLAFIGTLFLLEFARNILYLGWDYDFLFHKFTNGSLLLFTFFMITDPVTTPNHRLSRWIWASCVAILTFTLGNWFQVHTAPVWALFFVTPATVLFDRLFIAQKFQWIKNQ